MVHSAASRHGCRNTAISNQGRKHGSRAAEKEKEEEMEEQEEEEEDEEEE